MLIPLVILAAGHAASASSATLPGGQPETHKDAKAVTVAGTVEQLLKTYRAGPISDRVTLRVVGADKKERRAQILLWVDRAQSGEPPAAPAPSATPTPGPAATPDQPPAKPAPPPRTPQIRLDLGQLQIHTQAGVNGMITAVNRFERSTVYTAQVKAASSETLLAELSSHFQAMPFPQLAFAMGGDAPLADAMPLTPGLTFDSAEAGVESGRAVVVMKGRHTGGRFGGPVTMSVERATGRLRRFAAEFDGASGGAISRVELVCAPSDAGEAEKWGISLEGRSIVKSPADLAPRRPGLAAGESIRNASLMSEDLAPLSPETLLPKLPGNTPGGGSGRVVLVCFRGDGDAPPSEADLKAAAIAAGRAAKLAGGETPASAAVVRGVALLGLSEIDPTRLSALAARWRAIAAEAGLVDAGLLFTASRVLSAEEKNTAVDTFVVHVNSDLAVRTVTIADRKGTTADGKPADQATLDSMVTEIAGK